MTDLSLPAKTVRQQEQYIQRQTNFYKQTISENNARLDLKTMQDDVRDEIKFIESQLLAKYGEPV